MGMNEEVFNSFLGLFKNVLHELGVSNSNVAEVMALLHGARHGAWAIQSAERNAFAPRFGWRCRASPYSEADSVAGYGPRCRNTVGQSAVERRQRRESRSTRRGSRCPTLEKPSQRATHRGPKAYT